MPPEINIILHVYINNNKHSIQFEKNEVLQKLLLNGTER